MCLFLQLLAREGKACMQVPCMCKMCRSDDVHRFVNKAHDCAGGNRVWGRFILPAVDIWMAGGPGKRNSHGTYSLAIFTSASALCPCFRVMER